MTETKKRNSNKEQRYKYEVEKDGDYEYIRAYLKGDKLPNGKIVESSKTSYIQIRHKYCNSIYELQSGSFINRGSRCIRCCKSYENSFAHHIEVELGEPLEKYWDFEKNTLNPYHIYKNSRNKVWIKCQEKDYHESYETDCTRFINGNRCSYCSKRKVHPKDSFAQYHIDNTDKDFLEKYWDWEKNILNPWEISPNSHKKVWIKCQSEEINELNGLKKKDYHDSNYVVCNDFTSGYKCSYCGNNTNKVHSYDSFGYHNFDKVLSWHPDNNISPFRVSFGSKRKFKFICEKCGYIWESSLNNISSNNAWCPKCKMSTGEKAITRWLQVNNIPYKHEITYANLIGVNGGLLSYDFYLPSHNIFIEYQGRQHGEYIPGLHKTYKEFEIQQEHDRRKCEYADKHGIKLLEIWYWDFDNIEEILERELINNGEII